MFNNNNLSALMICMMNHTSLQRNLTRYIRLRVCDTVRQIRGYVRSSTAFLLSRTHFSNFHSPSPPFFIQTTAGWEPQRLQRAFGRDIKSGRRPFSSRSGSIRAICPPWPRSTVYSNKIQHM